MKTDDFLSLDGPNFQPDLTAPSRYGREVAVMPQNVAERVAKRGGILSSKLVALVVAGLILLGHRFIGIDEGPLICFRLVCANPGLRIPHPVQQLRF